jgi:hypothetical protein
MSLSILYEGQDFVLFLILIMISTNIMKEKMLMIDTIGLLGTYISNRKIMIFLTSLFFGILPIPGRIVLGSSVLNSMTKQKMSYRIGVLEYLSTHHYYFWSPLEKTVIVPMSILGISYMSYISVVWPVIALSVAFLIVYLWFFVPEEDILIKFPSSFKWINIFKYTLPIFVFIGVVAFNEEYLLYSGIGLFLYYSLMSKVTFRELKNHIKHLNYKLILLLISTIIIGNNIKEIHLQVINTELLMIALGVSFLYSFALGSSSKYAMISALLISTFGLQYMLMFLVLDFAGYILSPTHKCFWVAASYYEMQLKKFIGVISLWLLILITYTSIITFIKF